MKCLLATTRQCRTRRASSEWNTDPSQDGLVLPTALGLESDSFSSGWRSVRRLDSDSLDRKLRALGWRMFFMAGQVEAIILGRGGDKAIYRAVQRITQKVRSLDFNCVGLTEVARKSFWGIPYIAISAHSYQIQESDRMESKEEQQRQCRKRAVNSR